VEEKKEEEEEEEEKKAYTVGYPFISYPSFMT
jgi:hypothetical protein